MQWGLKQCVGSTISSFLFVVLPKTICIFKHHHGSMWPSLSATGPHIVPFLEFSFIIWYHHIVCTPLTYQIVLQPMYSVVWDILWHAGIPPPHPPRCILTVICGNAVEMTLIVGVMLFHVSRNHNICKNSYDGYYLTAIRIIAILLGSLYSIY